MDSNKKLVILVATMTGTAGIVADDISDHCKNENITTEIHEMDTIEPKIILSYKDPILICSSTYGQGDVPDNAKKLYSFLKKDKPKLSNIRYAIFGLGDLATHRDTFAFGGKKFDKILSSLGAKRIDTPYYHDASDGSLPEEVAVEWFKKNIQNLL